MSAFPEPMARPAAEAIPSGTVTFAFSDIAGSTTRWERDRAAMEDAVRRHDGIVRAAFAGQGGYVFKTIGDAFCAAFSRPEGAVDAALAAQRALGSEDFSAVGGLTVRMALHTGAVDERGGDYFGPVVNRVSGLLSVAHGGQVLVSGVTADLVRDALPVATTLRDLGEHRLKDLARPERIFELLAPQLAGGFPALRSLDAIPNNLPLVATSFVGRASEVAEIAALLQRRRFVTLVGSGGIGKTRAALQVAANVLEAWPDGVWFVELAPLASGEYIAPAIARALGIMLAAEGDPVTNLARALERKRLLLVFDNCEHLVESVAAVGSALLRGCPSLKILASSRQGLDVPGEDTFRLPSLDIAHTSVALFAERARAVDHRFELTAENAPTIAEICRRLDGIPLAIELAAARVRILSPRQLQERLDERFRLLTGGSRSALPRQQTLRALMDWSHDLLDERERVLFRRLAAFVNGFTLEGAVAVGAGDEVDEFDILDLLASLVDKSLVVAERTGDTLRYRMLESTHVYAREKLAAAGDAERCADRHLRFLIARFGELRRSYEETARRRDLDDAFATELEDVRAALDYALGAGDPSLGAELLAETTSRAWATVGLHRESAARARALAARLPADAHALRAQLAIAIAVVTSNDGLRTTAMEAAAEGVTHARACGDTRILALALIAFARHRATQLQYLDDAEAAIAEVEAMTGLPPEIRMRMLHDRAFVSWQRGDHASAASAYEHLRAEHRALGNTSFENLASLNLAEVEHTRGNTRRGIEILTEILPNARDRDRDVLVTTLANLAAYHATVGDVVASRAAACDVVRELAPNEPTATFLSVALEHLSLALALAGDLERAAALHGYADAALRASGFERQFTEIQTNERVAALLAERLPPDDLARRLAAGATLRPEAAIALALE